MGYQPRIAGIAIRTAGWLALQCVRTSIL